MSSELTGGTLQSVSGVSAVLNVVEGAAVIPAGS